MQRRTRRIHHRQRKRSHHRQRKRFGALHHHHRLFFLDNRVKLHPLRKRHNNPQLNNPQLLISSSERIHHPIMRRFFKTMINLSPRSAIFLLPSLLFLLWASISTQMLYRFLHQLRHLSLYSVATMGKSISKQFNQPTMSSLSMASFGLSETTPCISKQAIWYPFLYRIFPAIQRPT